MNMYDQGLALSTHKNRYNQARRFVAFMIDHNLNPLAPRTYDILQYAVYLFANFKSPASVKNALSGAKNWVQEQDGSYAAFLAPSVKRLCKGGERRAAHQICPAPPLTPASLQAVIRYLMSFGEATAMPVAALLIGYFSFVRQSNLVSPSRGVWGGPHTLRRRDIRPCRAGLQICIRSSKTILSEMNAVELLVPAVPNSKLCPVMAWSKALSAVPAPGLAPAFMLSLSQPLDSKTLTRFLRLSLRMVDVPFPQHYTLRSLRRGAAQACQSLGVPLAAIKAQGTWVSSAVFSYVPRRAPSAAPLALASLFGRATGAAEVSG